MEASSSPHAARPPPRPRLGSRSQTHGPVLASPPKKRTTGDNGIDSPTKPKPKPKEHHHHLPFFSGSSHDKDPKADSSSKHDQTSRNESSSSKHDSNSKHDQSSSRDHSHKYLPHIPYVSRKTTDAASSKKDLRQQIKNVNPVEGLQTMMSNRSGHQLDDASVKQQQSSGDSQEPTVAPRVVKMPDRLVRPEDVARERERAKLRERELHQSLNDLSDLGTSTTRRLDNTFYSILEKAGQLRSIIESLQELSQSSNELHQRFGDDASSAKEELQKQVDAFGGFEGQQREVEGLVGRIKDAQSKSGTLSARLEAARKRVDTWEAREREWQQKTSKRLTLSWILTLLFVLFIAALLVWRRFEYPGLRRPGEVRIAHNESLPDFIINDLKEYHTKYLSTREEHPTSTASSMPADTRLKRLDEL